MSLGIDPIAFLTSLFAIWFAYTETRKSNNVLVQILRRQAATKGNVRENRGQSFVELSVLVRNQGISLHDPNMSLSFRGANGYGLFSLPLRRRDERTGEHSEFARGMIAEFSLKSYELDTGDRQFLANLVDLAKQEARFSLFSQGYLARVFPMGRLRDRMASKWNSWAYKFNRKFDRRVGESGIELAAILPEKLLVLSTQVRSFIWQDQQLQQAAQQPSQAAQQAPSSQPA